MTKTLARAALLGAVASIPASKVKAISERQLQRAAETVWPPNEAEKQLVGADPTGHLENMPPAVIADRVARRLGHGPLDTTTKLRIQNAIHYTFGALSGSAYGALADAFPAATAGMGTAPRCRCCEFRRRRGTCPGRRSYGSSRVTSCSVRRWN